MHLIGCTFYGIFASGELQPWAEPPPEEQQVWAPPAGAITNDDPSQAGMMGTYMKETSFVSNSHLPLQGWFQLEASDYISPYLPICRAHPSTMSRAKCSNRMPLATAPLGTWPTIHLPWLALHHPLPSTLRLPRMAMWPAPATSTTRNHSHSRHSHNSQAPRIPTYSRPISSSSKLKVTYNSTDPINWYTIYEYSF